MNLKSYSLANLKKADEHLQNVEQTANKARKANPGPGWDPIFGMLDENRKALDAEINDRIKRGEL